MLLLPVASRFFQLNMKYRIAHYSIEQSRLKKRYGIEDNTPIHKYDDFTAAQIDAVAGELSDVRFATTSGTTGVPKRIIYTPQRLRQYRADALSCAVRAFIRYNIRNTTFFVLSSLKQDDSFSSFVLFSSKRPPYIVGLLEPARYLAQPAFIRQIDRFGASAVRLWLIVMSNPGVLYATNPSTIAAFFADIQERWIDTTAMVRANYQDQNAFSEMTPIVGRIASSGYLERVKIVARADHPIDLEHYWPGLSAWSSWDGGYVDPYVRQVKSFLSPDQYTHIPTFSMSTETVETLTHFTDDGQICFLPIAKNVVYEFLPEEKSEDPRELIGWNDLKAGSTYSMVVSDCYGLLRYHTEDVFVCRELVQGVPDLRFLRRRGISFSFTGEKVTALQLSEAFTQMTMEVPWLVESNAQMCCFPCGESSDVPHYHLAVVLPPGSQAIAPGDQKIASLFENKMSHLNQEFSDKRQSGRLGETHVSFLDYDRLAVCIDRRTKSNQDVSHRTWESQFKLSPLCLVPWEQIRTKVSDTYGYCDTQTSTDTS